MARFKTFSSMIFEGSPASLGGTGFTSKDVAPAASATAAFSGESALDNIDQEFETRAMPFFLYNTTDRAQ